MSRQPDTHYFYDKENKLVLTLTSYLHFYRGDIVIHNKINMKILQRAITLYPSGSIQHFQYRVETKEGKSDNT